jgi:hypothetical protein
MSTTAAGTVAANTCLDSEIETDILIAASGKSAPIADDRLIRADLMRPGLSPSSLSG